MDVKRNADCMHKYLSVTTCRYQLIIITASVLTLGHSLFGRYGQYITYFVKGFTPPQSFFQKRPLHFHPQTGERYQPAFEKAYGKHGENLVTVYGRGFSKKVLLQHGLL